MRRIILVLSVLLAAAVLDVSHCFSEEEKVKGKLSPILNVYNWEDYFAPTTLENFEKRFGVKVNLEIIDEEEAMISGLQSNPGKYDIVIASDLAVRELIKSRLLTPIELKNISNFKNIDQRFVNLDHDPGNQYSVPYMWGTSGIAYNTKYVKEEVNSWGIFWDPQYKGKMSMLINPYDVITVGLKHLGYSLSTVDPIQLEEAEKKLLEQRPLLRGYEDTTTIQNDLVSEKLWIGLTYTAVSLKDKNSNIKYVIPKEGAYLWFDNLCIPRDALHKYTAEVFINYILEPQVSAEIANHIKYANCNLAARPYTSEEILNNPALYPPEELLKNCEFYKDTGTVEERAKKEQIVNKTWAELQSSGE